MARSLHVAAKINAFERVLVAIRSSGLEVSKALAAKTIARLPYGERARVRSSSRSQAFA